MLDGLVTGLGLDIPQETAILNDPEIPDCETMVVFSEYVPIWFGGC